MVMRIMVGIVYCIIIVACRNASGKVTIPRNISGITVTDVKGKMISLGEPAERVVALFDPAIDALFMLYAADKLVGITAETYADKELFNIYKRLDPRIANKEIATPGTNESANLESIIQLKPDLVIVHQMPESMIKTLEGLGIAVYSASGEKYNEIIKEFEDLATLTGKQQRAASLLQYVKSKFAEMEAQSNTRAEKEKKSVYFTWAYGRIFSTTGRNSMMHKCLELAGVSNVCTTPLNQQNINPETLIKWDPDMIVMWNDSASLFYNKKELSGITAIKEKEVHNLLPMFFYNPHTLKSLCVAIKINNWAYHKNTLAADLEVDKAIQTLYGRRINTFK